MATRMAWRAARSHLLRQNATGPRRPYSTANGFLHFSVEIGPESQNQHKVLKAIENHAKLANAENHNSAVLLATPDYARWLEDDAFVQDLASLLSGSGKMPCDQFHVLCAVVDHIAPPVPRSRPIAGLSILRGRLNDMLPNHLLGSSKKDQEDADKVAALTFDFGNPALTLPLMNTTFLNHKLSTLFSTWCDLKHGTAKIGDRIERYEQQINLPLSRKLESVHDLGFWAPLVPLTRPRIVTESFGNIVRRVSINDDSVPASMELEPAVDELFKRNSSLAQTPMGIWAVITPPAFLQTGTATSIPDPEATFDEHHDIEALTASTSGYVGRLYGQGSRVYQILSGGGGWGAKKGLLSLDPERTHFALPDDMERGWFMQGMQGGNFVPVGSQIQFFASPGPSGDDAAHGTSRGFVFGTSGKLESSSAAPSTGEPRVLDNHFGALSQGGIFASSREPAEMVAAAGFSAEWKFNVPHSRVFVGNK